MKTASDYLNGYNVNANASHVTSKNVTILRLEVCKQMPTAVSMRSCLEETQSTLQHTYQFELGDLYYPVSLSIVVLIILFLILRK